MAGGRLRAAGEEPVAKVKLLAPARKGEQTSTIAIKVLYLIIKIITEVSSIHSYLTLQIVN
jgi:hypothetical protein